MSNRVLAGVMSLGLVFASFEGSTSAEPVEEYIDCGNGTVADLVKGLVWEQKQSYGGGPDSSRPHESENTYTWTAAPEPQRRLYRGKGTSPTKPAEAGPEDDTPRVDPNGTVFTKFLADLNRPDPISGECFANHCDWRLPDMHELERLRIRNCREVPCIDPIFGPSQTSRYWSAMTKEDRPEFAWASKFYQGAHSRSIKTTALYARAVRNGDCKN